MHLFSKRWCSLTLLLLLAQISVTSPSLLARTKPQPAYVRSGVGDLLTRVAPSKLSKTSAVGIPSLQAESLVQDADTVHVLAIRVQFQPDSRTTTTGDGTFDLSSTSDTKLDPPPHDRAYFQAQLQALANYYRNVSGGKLIVVGDVFPVDDNGSYQLSHPMVYYNPPEADQDDELRDRRLSELLRDAVVAADADSAVHFERYQSLIVFHAGVGQDFAFDFDPTPNDIPSVYLDRKTLAKALGDTADPESWPGIPVESGSYNITDGIILPETQNQQGYDIALLGTACLMFGHQLGLPALYNTETGRPGIGMWGLMDQGSGNLGGLVPAQPCAWSRVYLGWTKPNVVRHGEALPVAVWGSHDPHKVYKVPINADEYFLVENRQRDPNGDGIVVGHDAQGNRVEIRLMDDGSLRILPDGFQGVIVQLDDYDYGLPGSGILIWHVDESVLRAKLADNKVNADPDHRAVDLEEADGAQDIGQQYGFLSAGSGAENGVPEDAFWASNEINKLVNSSDEVAFTPWTEPNTNSYTGARSNISFTNFSEQDTVMTFSVTSGPVRPGFPVYAGAPFATPPVLADLDRDGTPEILVTTEDGRLLCWRGNGEPFVHRDDSLTFVSATGDSLSYPDATVYALSSLGPVLTPAVLYDSSGAQIWWGGEDDQLLTFRVPRSSPGHIALVSKTSLSGALEPRLGPAGWLGPDSLWYLVLPSTRGLTLDLSVWGWTPDRGLFSETRLVPVFSDGTYLAFSSLGQAGFVALDNNGDIHQVGPDLQPGWTVHAPKGSFCLATADLDGDGLIETFALSSEGIVDGFDQSGNRLPGFPTRPYGTCSAPLAIGNVDGRGPLELVFATDDGHLVVLQRNGVLLDEWPIVLRRGPDPAPVAPILVDLDGDGAEEIVVPDQNGGLQALDSHGRQMDGFPAATSAEAAFSAAVGDVDGDGLLEILLAGRDGFLYAWKTNATSLSTWSQYKADAQHTGLAAGTGLQPTSSEGVAGLMPADRVYCYPNPTDGDRAVIRFYLTANADVTIRIFDLAGTKVAELKAHGLRYTDNEIIWDASRVASGVYLASVEARSDATVEKTLIKIAVTR